MNGSKERITEREYWAAKKGQLALDKENAVREAAGQPTKPTKFETDKAKLRRTIRQALSQAASFDEFSSLLLREGVTVKESRGRLSYLTPDRTKPITARKLGDDFDKAAVLALLTQNAHRAAEQTKAIPEYPVAVKKPSQGEKTTKTTPADNTLQRMVDREAKRAEGKGVGYDRWAAKHKLKQQILSESAAKQEDSKLEISRLRRRIGELEHMTAKLYEDKVSGAINGDTFAVLIQKSEQERIQKADRLDALLSEERKARQEVENIRQWAGIVRRYLDVQELDREIVEELIDHIEIGERSIIDGQRHQDIKIFYRFVGVV